ncbi:hypothetical protein [Spiroplasma poulsonii]|uniref:hypothetical protein n=1 Tax=Spiroplasma poulsonii TaxID=2138 RepID=UPI001F4CFE3B|nr:hypothetical protein [Spiroplasma poulsonii]UNF61609.1 hypothetical protein MNU24_06775 [Spiroplasma poulsonii]
MYLNLFRTSEDVIASYMQHYKINDILDLASNGWKILQNWEKKINPNRLKYIITPIDPGIGQNWYYYL